MSFRLYVGNYPSDFSRKDVASIFQEFDGVKVERQFKKANKCYSFLLCKDIDQLVSVIQRMNNITVSGRTLKVRASENSLQKYVELLLQEASDCSGTSQEGVIDANPKESPREGSHDANAGGFLREKHYDANVGKLPHGKSYVETQSFVPLQVLRKKTTYQKECEKGTDEQFEINSYHSSSPTQCSNLEENNYIGTAHCSELETTSQRSSYSNDTSVYRHDEGFSELTWVSVTNFPLRTSVRAISDLFSDYKPIKIKMICNEARRDRTLTEAHICFLNRDIADDVILNFDNTMFLGRLLLVNDIEDLTIMNELLNVVH